MKQLPPPRIAAIHDLSCVGRCALTVILPTLSAMGYQTVPIPTALLSTHTGGFTDLHFRDLTDDMHGISAHFEEIGMTFRAIYTGFLGSERQIHTVESLIDRFGELPDESGRKPLILVDPVMGDDGALYSTYTPELVAGIRQLSRRAQVLTPNLTEACLLTDTPYRDTSRMRPAEAEEFAYSLLNLLCAELDAQLVITGIVTSDGCVMNVGRDKNGSFSVKRVQSGVSYPGTGDIFASVLLGELLAGEVLRDAVSAAANFVGDLIDASAAIDTPVRFGVALEPQLCKLIK